MKIKYSVLCLLPLFFLAACKTSAVWYETHPDRKDVMIDGHEISVVPNGTNQYDAFGGTDGLDTNMSKVKQRQIQGIEKITGCKVVGAEFLMGTYVLQTQVRCPR